MIGISFVVRHASAGRTNVRHYERLTTPDDAKKLNVIAIVEGVGCFDFDFVVDGDADDVILEVEVGEQIVDGGVVGQGEGGAAFGVGGELFAQDAVQANRDLHMRIFY